MIKSILLSRAVATATAVLGACLLAYASPASAFTPPQKGGSESSPLNLNTSTGSTHPTTGGGGGASIVRTIVGLAIVIAVIWGLAWILKQVKAGREPSVASTGLASVAALTLGSGRAVHLVRAGSDFVLLGATEHGLAPIHRYTEAQAREAGLYFEEPAPERSRLVTVAGQLVAGAGRAVGQGSYAARSGFTGPGAPFGENGQDGQAGPVGVYDAYQGIRDPSVHSPAAGGSAARPDPMRTTSQPSGLIGRLREMTVRR